MAKTAAQLLEEALASYDSKRAVAAKQEARPTVMRMLLDASVSMESRHSVTIRGANLFIHNTAMLVQGTPVELTVTAFNENLLRPMINRRPIGEGNLIDSDKYVIYGGTALYDAIGHTIIDMEQQLDGRNAVVVIQTDGEDMNSQDLSAASLAQLIAKKRGEGWQFVFLGLGVDSYTTAKEIGVDPLSTLSYDGMQSTTAFIEASRNVAKQITGASKTTGFSEAQRKLVGDQFYKQAKLPPAAEDMKQVAGDKDAGLKRLLE